MTAISLQDLPKACGGLDLLVIQPTPFCNLNCDYCYLPHRSDRSRMTFETLEKTFERVFACDFAQKGFTVVWHAGEPMTLPVSFYREALARIERLRPPNLVVRYSLQTNATLVTPEWCDFIHESGFGIGVSIDGPADLHDARRKTRAGGGTHARAMRGIEMLRAHDIPFHVITVLTERSLDRADDIFEFYVRNGMTQIGFNIEEIEAANPTSSLSGPAIQDRFTAFIRRFLALSRTTTPPLDVREFREAVAAIIHPPTNGIANRQATPFAILNIDHAGNFTTFSPELLGIDSDCYGRFIFGNVWTSSFDSMIGNQRFQKVHHDIRQGIANCRYSCPYFSVCGGGAPANKYFEVGSFASTKTLYCRLTKMAINDVILEDIELALAKMRQINLISTIQAKRTEKTS
jgi:uncharacterized protein